MRARNIEHNLKTIRRLSLENEEENWEFYSFLKGYCADAEMDRIVHTLYYRIVAEVDCTACANCCQELDIILYENDIQTFSQGLGMSSEQFTRQYLQENLEFGGTIRDGFAFTQKPCPFLKTNVCQYYAHRPEGCRKYPYVQEKDFLCRLHGVIQDYAVCPIVFNVCEVLKDEIGFDRQSRKYTNMSLMYQ